MIGGCGQGARPFWRATTYTVCRPAKDERWLHDTSHTHTQFTASAERASMRMLTKLHRGVSMRRPRRRLGQVLQRLRWRRDATRLPALLSVFDFFLAVAFRRGQEPRLEQVLVVQARVWPAAQELLRVRPGRGTVPRCRATLRRRRLSRGLWGHRAPLLAIRDACCWERRRWRGIRAHALSVALGSAGMR